MNGSGRGTSGIARARKLRGALPAALAMGLLSAPAHADLVQDVRGHLALGYARLFIEDAPQGSASFGAGLAYPVRSDLSAGVAIDYHLLGGHTAKRDGQTADVDYSLFVADAALDWRPRAAGPVRMVSLLAGLYHARAEVTSSFDALEFLDLARSETVPGFGLAVTLMPGPARSLEAGLELAGHVALLEAENWGLVTARLAVHY